MIKQVKEDCVTKRFIRKTASLIKGRFPLLFALLKRGSKLFPPLYKYINSKLVDPPKSARRNFTFLQEIANKEYDLKFPGKIKSNVIICFNARTGSNLLCKMMEDNGMMGQPAEYFLDTVIAPLMHRFGAKNLKKYVYGLQHHRTSPNGIFSFKIQYPQYLQSFGDKPFEKYFKKIKYIRLRRRDVLAQAVSFAKANMTGEWVSLGKNIPDKYKIRWYDSLNEEIIKTSYNRIYQMNKGWDEYFNCKDVEVLTLNYEKFTANPGNTLGQVFNYLEIEQPNGFTIKETHLKRQADEDERMTEKT